VVESQLARVGHPSLHQLPRTGGIDRRQAFSLGQLRRRVSYSSLPTTEKKVSLTPGQNTSRRNIARAIIPLGSERLKTKLPIPRSNRLAGTKHSWMGHWRPRRSGWPLTQLFQLWSGLSSFPALAVCGLGISDIGFPVPSWGRPSREFTGKASKDYLQRSSAAACFSTSR
jgi:hypothetical protein